LPLARNRKLCCWDTLREVSRSILDRFKIENPGLTLGKTAECVGDTLGGGGCENLLDAERLPLIMRRMDLM
jgi:hypothetical protein